MKSYKISLMIDGVEVLWSDYAKYIKECEAAGTKYAPSSDEWLKVVVEGIKEELTKN